MGRVDTILADEPVSRQVQPTNDSSIKTILFHVHEDNGLDARLQAALSLARATGAHLHMLSITPVEAYTVVDIYGGSFVSGAIVETLEEEAAKLRTRLEQQLASEDVSWDYETVTAQVLGHLMRAAALADLVITGREPHWHEFSQSGIGLLGNMLHHVRTPLMIPGDDIRTFDPFASAVIAWNGSIEAANAVRGAPGLLKMASAVRVVRFTESMERRFPDTRLLEYLSRQGIHAALDTPRSSGSNGASDLLEYATFNDASYIVLGGYSHSRAGEFIFGGVTRTLLSECPKTLVMAH